MDKDQVLKALRQSKRIEGPPTDALLGRTGLNGVFKTRQPVGGQTFSLNFDYDPSGGLRGVVFYSRSKFKGAEYETRLKSAYKALLVGLTESTGNLPTCRNGCRRIPCRKGASCTCTCGGWLPACFNVRPGEHGGHGGVLPRIPPFRSGGHASQIQEGPGGVEEGMGRHSGIP